MRLHADVWPGDGVPFVLVHGLASNARMWRGVAGRLAGLGHAVAAVDLRGHGRSPKPDDGYDFATVTADLVETIDDLGWEQPVVAGQSWGGNVAVELAWRRPDLLRGVAGIDGGDIELQDRFESWEECAAALAPPPLEGTPVDEMERRIRVDHPDWPDDGVAGMLGCFEVRADGTVAPWLTRDRHMRILRALWEHRPSTFVADIKVPLVLVPAGPGDDHDLHAQQPERVATLLHEAFPP